MKRTALLIGAICIAWLGFPAAASSQNATPAASPTASIPPDSAKYGVYPIAYREIITRWVGERLLDPASAQLEFTNPVAAEIKTKTGRASGYAVDFRVNSRNKFGMYTGFQKYRVLIRNGEIVWSDRVRS